MDARLLEALNVLARGTFDELDPELEPFVSLVGVPVADASADRVAVLSSGSAAEADAFAAAIRQASVRHAATRPPGGLPPLLERTDGWRRLLEETAAREAAPRGALAFVSSGRLRAGRLVHVVLQLRKDVAARYPALVRRRSPTGVAVATSLLDAATTEFLAAAAAAAAESADGQAAVSWPRSPDEIVRAAGRVLLETAAFAAGNPERAHLLFPTCHRISTRTYEGFAGSGDLIVAPVGHPDVLLELAFHTRIALDDHRAVRKVLELAGEGLALISDSSDLVGLGRVAADYDPAEENLFRVTFHGLGRWELAHAGTVLMTVADGTPRLPRGELDEAEFRRLLRDVFGASHRVAVDRLWRIVVEAARQRRGTLVVISSRAEAEALRLGRQALRLEPVLLAPDRVPLLSAIDGALLLDLEGSCHAVGVILDGRASRRGDPARGARFNSAVRYVDAADHPCAAFVVSEEGGVDLIRPLG